MPTSHSESSLPPLFLLTFPSWYLIRVPFVKAEGSLLPGPSQLLLPQSLLRTLTLHTAPGSCVPSGPCLSKSCSSPSLKCLPHCSLIPPHPSSLSSSCHFLWKSLLPAQVGLLCLAGASQHQLRSLPKDQYCIVMPVHTLLGSKHQTGLFPFLPLCTSAGCNICRMNK